MAAIERPLHFHVVTSATARANAFATLLGPENVTQVLPHFTEDIIRKPSNNDPAEWPIEMAERKAFQDVAALMVRSYVDGVVNTGAVGDVQNNDKHVIRLYSDTINIAYAGDINDSATVVMEKPRNLAQWINDRERGAMGLSGKHTELCTALTAIDMSDTSVHPTTVLVRTAVKMKPFTIADVKQFVKDHGEDAIMKSASGISFINDTVELFDTNYPMRQYVQTDPNYPPTLVREYPTWDHLTREERQRILYGAIPDAIDILTTQFPVASPTERGRSTSERYPRSETLTDQNT